MKSIQYSRLFGSVRGAVLLKMMSCAAACQRLLLFEVDCRFVRPPFSTCYVVHLQIYCFYGPCNFNDKYTAHWYWFYYVLLELLYTQWCSNYTPIRIIKLCVPTYSYCRHRWKLQKEIVTKNKTGIPTYIRLMLLHVLLIEYSPWYLRTRQT